MSKDFDSDDSCGDPSVTEENLSNKSQFEVSDYCQVHLLETNKIILTSEPEPVAHCSEQNSNIINKETEGRKKRGRKREYGGILRTERSRRKYANEEYVDYKKRVIPAKEFKDFQCACMLKCCEKIPFKIRKLEREKFLALASYTAQGLYLESNILEFPKKRSYVRTGTKNNEKKKKEFSRIYQLNDIQVCRDMFVKTYGVSSNRVNTILKKFRSGENVTDQRGVKQGGFNKLKKQ